MDVSLVLNRRPTGKPVPRKTRPQKLLQLGWAQYGLAGLTAWGPAVSLHLIAYLRSGFFGTGLLVHDASSLPRLPVALCMPL